ncbi:hypothetical protein VNO78_34818 [Psophocarpus tetragonolobus]|uniref:Uncharacterized protein n=1 Tax=Psophocarpus tetragonolobus TaxID=3891 RepID=A0AAN9RM94_PSOTE
MGDECWKLHDKRRRHHYHHSTNNQSRLVFLGFRQQLLPDRSVDSMKDGGLNDDFDALRVLSWPRFIKVRDPNDAPAFNLLRNGASSNFDFASGIGDLTKVSTSVNYRRKRKEW